MNILLLGMWFYMNNLLLFVPNLGLNLPVFLELLQSYNSLTSCKGSLAWKYSLALSKGYWLLIVFNTKAYKISEEVGALVLECSGPW